MENVDNTMDLFKALLALLVVIGVIGIPAYFILKVKSTDINRKHIVIFR